MELTRETLRELLDYNPETGDFTWRFRSRKWFKTDRSWRRFNNNVANTKAGSVSTNKDNYQSVLIGLLGKTRKAHRLAWLWMTEEPLPEQIDHKNQNATDNRWSNLRASDPKSNGKNQSKRRNNTSGTTGVSWHKPLKRWRVQANKGGKKVHVGYFTDLVQAEEAARQSYEELGYSRLHGEKGAHYYENN